MHRVRGHEKAAPLEVRFWAKVDKRGPVPSHLPKLGRCWVWTAAKGGSLGYARLVVNKKLVPGTHVAIYLATGHWPKLEALHKCDNAACVRFSHLFEGTQRKNLEDMARKGRTTAKLTSVEVEGIISKVSAGRSQRELAKEYNVHQTTISHIICGKQWKHITTLEEKK
jgi:uncharacterized protein (DUF433 family)